MDEKLKSMDEIRAIAEEERKAEQHNEPIVEQVEEKPVENDNLPQVNEQHNGLQVAEAVDTIKGGIVSKAVDKVNDEKTIDKFSTQLSEVGKESIEADIEKERLGVEEKKASNKVHKQEIKNKLLELATEKKRLKAEQKQILKEQKADHKKRNKDAKWELYKEKLGKMGYTYVPNPFVLAMLLMFDGIVSFFDGVAKTSTAIVKALKWLIFIGLIIVILMVIPLTREWFLSLLKFK